MNKMIPMILIGILVISGGGMVVRAHTITSYLDPPSGPCYGYTGVEYTFYFVIPVDPNGDEYFTQWNWDDGTITDWLGPYASGLTTSESHLWTDAGVYEIRVRLKDMNGIESNWSEPHQITIVCSGPPITPIITGPHYGRVGVAYNFTIMTTNPEGDMFFYLLRWGDGTFSGWMGPYASGEDAILSHAWSEPGTYSIMIKLKDISGAESDWSDPFLITIVRLQPKFFIGTFKNITKTDDLIVLQACFFLVFPSHPLFYHAKTIVIGKESRGYVGASFTYGIGGMAIP